MKKHFLTFGSKSWEGAVQRITAEAYATGEFDVIHPRGEGDLADAPHRFLTDGGSRGYGYWFWKPYLALQVMKKMDEGDVLCYADAGNTLSPGERWKHYLDLCVQTGGCFFFTRYPERMYTKADTIELLRGPLSLGTQIWAGAFFLTKNKENMQLLSYWDSCFAVPNLVNDVPSVLPNDPSFVAHRHDQSCLSLVVKNAYVGPFGPRGLGEAPLGSCFLDHDTENFGDGRAIACTRKHG